MRKLILAATAITATLATFSTASIAAPAPSGLPTTLHATVVGVHAPQAALDGAANFGAVQLARVERPEKIEKPEKVEKLEKAERPEKVEKPEKVERPEKVG